MTSLFSEQQAEDAGAGDKGEEPQAEPTLDGAHPSGDVGEDARSFDAVMEEMAAIAARQAELVAEAKASCSHSLQEKVTSLQMQLAAAQAELASSKAEQERAEAYARRVAEEKLAIVAELAQERAAVGRHQLDAEWALKFLQQNKDQHIANLEAFCSKVSDALDTQEGKLRKLSIEFDEELYPHLVQSVAERR